jgi:hypothetical protein
MTAVVGDVLSWILENLGWVFVLTTAGFLTFVLFLSRGDERGFESRRSPLRGRTSTASE